MSPVFIVILAPLVTALVIVLLRKVPEYLALIGIAVTLIASIIVLKTVTTGVTIDLVLPGLPNMPLLLTATALTALLSTMVAVIAFLVLVYAIGYMKHDNEKPRFFATMLLFIAAMQTLVLAGDWILFLSAWELIGLSCYLLIGFWFRKPEVKQAATRAFMVARSADLGLYIAVFILIGEVGSSEIALTLNISGGIEIIPGILLLIAAMGKSAQTPLHDWLQRAMAGPTPVSALLHSATLVAIGVILLIRTAPILSDDTLLVVGIVGGITSVVTGLIALGESDLKRMLAASTSSQYGLMLVAIGAGVPMAALLHLIAHAAIKSSLFLGAGVFQHSRDTTMLEQLRGVGRDRPKIFIGFTVAALALAGIPPLSGFFSKDAIIAATLSSNNVALLLPFALAGTVLTGSYVARVLRILWQKNASSQSVAGLTWMGAGLTGLVAMAVVLGIAFPKIELFLQSLLTINAIENPVDWLIPAILGLIAALSGLLLGWFIPVQILLGPIFNWASRGFVIAGGFDNLLVRPADVIARHCEKLETFLYRGVLAFGKLGLKIAKAFHSFEIHLYDAVLGIGKSGLKFSKMIHRIDEQVIDEFIFSFVRVTVNLGSKARNLQSGLIHKELAITTIASAMIFIFTFITILLY